MRPEIKRRESGIEVLKIVAILLIVISHVTQTLSSFNEHFPSDYVIDVSVASKSVTNFILLIFRYFGQQGNYIFFVCSAWFLIESNEIKLKKIISMLINTWLVSVIILACFLLTNLHPLPLKTIVFNLFPTTFANNWYITCYLLFYMIHPALNLVIEHFEKQYFCIAVCVMLVFYYGVSFLFPGCFFNSPLIDFIVMYFVVAFLKKYGFGFCQNIKLNFMALFLGVVFNTVLLLVTNFLGLRYGFFNDKLMRWSGSNPFLLVMAIALLNLFRQVRLSSTLINYVSSLSLLIYIIHENLLVRTYLRPPVFIWIKERFGYSQIIGLVLLYSLVLFIISIVLAMMYRETIGRFINKIVKNKMSGLDRGK